MKKHILGVALFSLIVASFAIIFAFFYSPALPPKEAVKPPVSRTEPRSEKPYCNLRKNNLSYEVLDSIYWVASNTLVSKIRIKLDYNANLPDKIYISTTYSSADLIGKDGFRDYKVVENPFVSSREVTITMVSKVGDGTKFKKDNLYALASVTDQEGSENYNRNIDEKKAKSVLFVYNAKAVAK